MEYRNELKYVCESNELTILEARLKNIIKYDKYLNENKTYNIRSIYFDDYFDNCFLENESGIDDRMKVRIRIYNGSSDVIKLELKYKLNGMTKKSSCNITKKMCLKLINGKPISLLECNNNTLNVLYLNMHTKLLKPKIIVEYDRTVFVNQLGNVRITFDKNIRASKYINKFFDESCFSIPILETNQHVLEVKYDELLPSYIENLINMGNLSQTSFSKYYLSRIRIGES